MQRRIGWKPVANTLQRTTIVSMIQHVDQKLMYEAAKAALPIFGGEDPESTTTTTDSKPATTDTKPATTSSDGAGADVDPVAKLQADPQAISQLLSQIGDLQKQVKSLGDANEKFQQEEQKRVKATQTREQQLEGDLQEAQQIIAKQNAVIQYTAKINAIQSMKDIEFHSARHVLNEIGDESINITVDLERGTATVDGMEKEIQRVAKEMPWLVSKNKATEQQQGTGPIPPKPLRSSGGPPAGPGGGSGDKAAKRDVLMKKYPALMGQR